MNLKILILPGDGIGTEVTRAAVDVLHAVAKKFGHTLELSEGLLGGIAIHKTGTPFPDDTRAKAQGVDAILMGAVGLPEFDAAPPSQRPEKGLLELRSLLDVYANLRPVRTYPELIESSPLKNHVISGTDMIIVRELTGGLYYGQPRGITADRGFNTMIDVMGADHGGYVKRMTAAVKAISGGKATLDLKLCQLVKLVRDGVDALLVPVDDVDALAAAIGRIITDSTVAARLALNGHQGRGVAEGAAHLEPGDLAGFVVAALGDHVHAVLVVAAEPDFALPRDPHRRGRACQVAACILGFGDQFDLAGLLHRFGDDSRLSAGRQRENECNLGRRASRRGLHAAAL